MSRPHALLVPRRMRPRFLGNKIWAAGRQNSGAGVACVVLPSVFHPPTQCPQTHCMSNAALNAIRNTREQLTREVEKAVGHRTATNTVNRNEGNLKLVATCVAMGLYPNVAWKVPSDPLVGGCVVAALVVRAQRQPCMALHTGTRNPPLSKQCRSPTNVRRWFRQFSHRGFWWCIFQLAVLCATV